MARFMAAQNAALVLGEEWEAVEVLVEKIMKTGDYERITVADAGGVVRAASDRQAGRSAVQTAGPVNRWACATGGRTLRGQRPADAGLRRAGHVQDGGQPRGIGIRERPLTG